MMILDTPLPWCVGLSWNPDWTSGRQTSHFRRHTPRSKGYWQISFSPEQSQAFFSDCQLQLNWMLPDFCSYHIYTPEITVDHGRKTIWFPLPHGRSIHLLGQYFSQSGSIGDLDTFILDWFDSINPSQFTLCESRAGYYRFSAGDPFRLDHDVHVAIPDDLLEDPIRNGSPDKRHGFNPWNPIQHLKIRDYLETEVRAQFEGV